MPTVPTFVVRENNVSRHDGVPRVPPLCRETSVSRTANYGTVGKKWVAKTQRLAKMGLIYVWQVLLLQVRPFFYLGIEILLIK